MSVELWKDGKYLGVVSARIEEYINKLEARVGALKPERDRMQRYAENVESENFRVRRRIRRLHRWLRKTRVQRHNLYNVIAAYNTVHNGLLARYEATQEVTGE